MDTTWIVSADEGRARFFSESTPGEALQEVDNMVNNAARMTAAEQYTDRLDTKAAGKSIHNTGGALPNSQYEPQQTPDERAAELFARDVCAYLLQAQQAGRFQKLALVAAPKFLGVLRKHLGAQLQPLVTLEINKDYSHSSAHQLRDQIQAHNAQQ
jgi:protein required for attachment to host cells